jgi:hypothetical protein
MRYIIPVYLLTRLPSSKRFAVTRLISEDEICRIGVFTTRREAMQVARVLAGWNGRVLEG